MSWELSRRNFKRSIYCDRHGGYLVIKHDRGICNEKTVPPFATKKSREGFNEISPPIAIAPPIATEILEDTAQSQQTFKHRIGIQARYRAIQRNYRVKGINIYPK